MPTLTGEHYPWTRVGYAKFRLKGDEPIPPFFVSDGLQTVSCRKGDLWATPAEQAAGRAKRERVRFPGYPIVISEDTTFIDCNFSQAAPHTVIFSVAPGVTVTFGNPEYDPKVPGSRRGDCNLTNVVVPDGAVIIGGNLSHGTMVATGNPARPEIRLLCECAKCACCRQEFQDCHDGKAAWIRDEHGRVLHHEMKERFRARRVGPKAAADLTKHATENADALARWSV